MEQNPEKLAPVIARLRTAVGARGRDPHAFTVRVVPRFVFGADGAPDLEATLAGVPALVKAGASMVELFPSAFCRGPDDFEAFCYAAGRAQRLLRNFTSAAFTACRRLLLHEMTCTGDEHDRP